jgi:hypothetical protein
MRIIVQGGPLDDQIEIAADDSLRHHPDLAASSRYSASIRSYSEPPMLLDRPYPSLRISLILGLRP